MPCVRCTRAREKRENALARARARARERERERESTEMMCNLGVCKARNDPDDYGSGPETVGLKAGEAGPEVALDDRAPLVETGGEGVEQGRSDEVSAPLSPEGERRVAARDNVPTKQPSSVLAPEGV